MDRFGGFAVGPFRLQCSSQDAATETSREFSIHMRLRSVLQFTATSISAQTPCAFCRMSVVVGTWKDSPCHTYHVHIVVSCCVCALVGGRICATYQIFASRHDCTYCTVWVRHNLAHGCRACARTAVVMCQVCSRGFFNGASEGDCQYFDL